MSAPRSAEGSTIAALFAVGGIAWLCFMVADLAGQVLR